MFRHCLISIFELCRHILKSILEIYLQAPVLNKHYSDMSYSTPWPGSTKSSRSYDGNLALPTQNGSNWSGKRLLTRAMWAVNLRRFQGLIMLVVSCWFPNMMEWFEGPGMVISNGVVNVIQWSCKPSNLGSGIVIYSKLWLGNMAVKRATQQFEEITMEMFTWKVEISTWKLPLTSGNFHFPNGNFHFPGGNFQCSAGTCLWFFQQNWVGLWHCYGSFCVHRHYM